jgi:hypothetical protein
MMSSDIVDQLKSHNARCILHSNIFKDSIIRENMKLAKRVLDKLSQEKQSQRTSLRARREDYFSASESESESENKRARLKKNSTYIYMPFFLLIFHQNVFQIILVYSSRQLVFDTNLVAFFAGRTGVRWPNIPGMPRSGSSAGGTSSGQWPPAPTTQIRSFDNNGY